MVLKNKIAKLLATQKTGILATFGRTFPFQNIIAITASDDVSHIVFMTSRNTVKYKNLKNNRHVSIQVDNRKNKKKDFKSASGLTAVGSAVELKGKQKENEVKIFLRRHPYLKTFALSEQCAVFSVRVKEYVFVENFEHVQKLKIRS